jgi:hypothetical protein
LKWGSGRDLCTAIVADNVVRGGAVLDGEKGWDGFLLALVS